MSATDELLNYISDQETLDDAEAFLCELPGFTPGYDVLFYSSYSDFEEYAWMALLHRDGQLYFVQGGYCVFDQVHADDRFAPEPVTPEQALADVKWCVANKE